MQKTLCITITGKVQGVYYRQSTRTKAIELSVSGIVMNLPDGSVQIIVTGTELQLAQLAAWCKTGPPRAIVTSVDVKELPLQQFTDFSIQR